MRKPIVFIVQNIGQAEWRLHCELLIKSWSGTNQAYHCNDWVEFSPSFHSSGVTLYLWGKEENIQIVLQ
jgi:hypothetical protein